MLDRPTAEVLLARLDEFAAELARFRSEIVAQLPAAEENGVDDLDGPWLDATSVAAQLGVPVDTVRNAARHKAIGRKRGGMWEINLPLLGQPGEKRLSTGFPARPTVPLQSPARSAVFPEIRARRD
jgi:hypothetical protein